MTEMLIAEAQSAIARFDDERGWGSRWDVKDLCLNINEEIGELWSLIKWISEDEQRAVVAKKHDEVADFVGDLLFLVLKLANQMKVDAGGALKMTLEEKHRRMPPDVMKRVKHANRHAGGHDNKGA